MKKIILTLNLAVAGLIAACHPTTYVVDTPNGTYRFSHGEYLFFRASEPSVERCNISGDSVTCTEVRILWGE